MKPTYVKPDSRNRIVLSKATKKLASLYKVYEKGNKIILEPVLDVPERERWLYDPKNRKLVEELKRRLKDEKGTISLSSFKKYLEEE